MSVVLMYHGIFPDNNPDVIDAEDLPYALSVSDFTRQLDLLAQSDVGLYDQSKMPEVVITFDDGHASAIELAAPLLLERELPAYFFVTTDFINQRDGFMSGDELAELSRMRGMCIGSHGVTHRFFDDLNSSESLDELISSKRALESWCEARCDSLSFPGGRFSPQTLAQLLEAGYTQWFGSEIGLVDTDRLHEGGEHVGTGSLLPSELKNAVENGHVDDSLERESDATLSASSDRWQLAALRGQQPLERVAIRRNTQLPEFRRIMCQDLNYFRQKRRNSQVKQLIRSVVGNRLYHGLYKSILAR